MKQFIANFFLHKKPLMMPRFKSPALLDLQKPKRVLVFAPHPDDDILGCGGTLYLLSKTASVCVVLVTDGSGAGELPSGTDQVRQMEFKTALNFLGIGQLTYLNQPDGSFEPNQSMRKSLIQILQSFDPDWVFLPARFDYHRDHILISQFVSETVVAISEKATLIEYETSAPLQATHLVDITDAFDLKVAALNKHETALRYGDYLRAITGLNSYRGLYLGFNKFAEAFKVNPKSSPSILLRLKTVYWRWRYGTQTTRR
jgi:LmbE family N-acetylglucosaminyl deacetylase